MWWIKCRPKFSTTWVLPRYILHHSITYQVYFLLFFHFFLLFPLHFIIDQHSIWFLFICSWHVFGGGQFCFILIQNLLWNVCRISCWPLCCQSLCPCEFLMALASSTRQTSLAPSLEFTSKLWRTRYSLQTHRRRHFYQTPNANLLRFGRLTLTTAPSSPHLKHYSNTLRKSRWPTHDEFASHHGFQTHVTCVLFWLSVCVSFLLLVTVN